MLHPSRRAAFGGPLTARSSPFKSLETNFPFMKFNAFHFPVRDFLSFLVC
jgi:hypothetical protein